MKKLTITKQIVELYKELERLEDILNFSVFYSFAEAFESHHYLPGFHLGDRYFEIHENYEELNVLEFSRNALLGDLGHILNDDDLEDLIKELKQL